MLIMIIDYTVLYTRGSSSIFGMFLLRFEEYCRFCM